MFVRLLIIAFSLSIYDVKSNGLEKEQAAQLEEFCHQGAEYHERRVFDAISSSEYIAWDEISLVDTSSRLNYTETILDEEHDKIITCDMVINYIYDDKEIALNTSFQVLMKEKQTVSNTQITDEAVTDFIVRVMVN